VAADDMCDPKGEMANSMIARNPIQPAKFATREIITSQIEPPAQIRWTPNSQLLKQMRLLA
jgi:hypothetical protein